VLKTSSKIVILLVVLLPALEICFQVEALADTSIEQLNDKLLELQQQNAKLLELQQQNARLLELQRQIIEMQKKYDYEANALKEKINQFAAKSDEQKAGDELASVQDSAKAGKVEPVISQNKPGDNQPQFLVNNNIQDTVVEKWRPYFHLTPKASEDRQLGRFNFMYPLSQSSDSMFFTDLRATFDNDNATEGNVGLGYRRIMPGDDGSDDWIWGVYGFYDRLISSHSNRFNQGTFGAELLKTNFELRGNLYIPDNASHVVGRNTVSSASLSGTTVMERTLSLEAYERSLPGFDAEIGYGFDIGKKDKLWIHGGYFYFDHSDTPEVAGPRLRLQYEWNDAFGLSDSTLAFGVEVQHDDVRETQTFASVTWSIPIGSQCKSREDSSNWRSIESRMMRPIIRDIDVVTFSDDITKAPGTTGGPELVSDTEAPLIDPATDQQVDMYFVTANGGATSEGTQDDPMTITQAETAASASDVIFLLNDDGDIDVSGASGGTLTLKPYQQLLGIGESTSKDVLLPKDLTLTISTAAGRPNLTRLIGNNVVTMLWDNTLDGITISGGNYGVYGLNVNNPTFRDVAIQNAGSHGIYLVNSSGAVSISDSAIQNNIRDAIYLENTAGGTVSIDVYDNDILSNGNQGIHIQNSNGSSAAVNVMNNQIVGNTNEGLRINNVTGSTLTAVVYDNLISGSGDDNIYVENSASTLNLVLNNNDITNSTTDAGINIRNILAGSIFSASFTDNRITGNFDQGLFLYNSGDSFNLTVRDNTITGNQAGGIDFDTDSGATVLTIADNIISSNIGGAVNNDFGIQIDQDSGASNTLALTLTNNLIENNGYTGIWLDNRDGTFTASLTGNSIANNGLYGLYIVNQTTGIFNVGLYNNAITGNADRGVWLSNNTGTLNALFENNTIAMNVGDGFELDNVNGGIFDYDLGGGTLGSAGLNSIFANGSGFDINNDTGADIKAENNWWGVAPPNPARFSGTVDFDPSLTSNPD